MCMKMIINPNLEYYSQCYYSCVLPRCRFAPTFAWLIRPSSERIASEHECPCKTLHPDASRATKTTKTKITQQHNNNSNNNNNIKTTTYKQQ